MASENKEVTRTPEASSAVKVEATKVEAKGLIGVGKDIAVGAVKGAVQGAVHGAVAGGLEGALLEANKAAANAAAVHAVANPGAVSTAVTQEAKPAKA